MAAIDALRLLVVVVRLRGKVKPEFMADVVAHAEEVDLSRIKQPAVVLTHAQQRAVERGPFVVQQFEMIVTLMPVWKVGSTAPVLHLTGIEGRGVD